MVLSSYIYEKTTFVSQRGPKVSLSGSPRSKHVTANAQSKRGSDFAVPKVKIARGIHSMGAIVTSPSVASSTDFASRLNMRQGRREGTGFGHILHAECRVAQFLISFHPWNLKNEANSIIITERYENRN